MSCVEKGLWLAVALGLSGCSEQNSKKESEAVAQGPEVDQATQVRQAVEAGQKGAAPVSEELEKPGAFDVEAVPEKPIEAKAKSVFSEQPAEAEPAQAEAKEEPQKEEAKAESSLEDSQAGAQESSPEKAEVKADGASEVAQEASAEDPKAESEETAEGKPDVKESLTEPSKAEGQEASPEKTEEAAEDVSVKEEKTGEAISVGSEKETVEEDSSEVKEALSTEAEEAKAEPAEEDEGSALESAVPVKASAELPDLSKLFVLARAELPAKSAKASAPIKSAAKAEKKEATTANVEDTDAVVKARIEELKTLQPGAPCVAWLDAHAATYIVRDGVLKKAPKGKLSEEDRQHFAHTFTEFIAANIKTFLPLIKDYSVEKVSLLRETKKLRNFALVMRENSTKEAINVEVLVTIKGLRIVDVVAKETSLRSILATSFQDLMQSKNPREAWDHLIQNGKSA